MACFLITYNNIMVSASKQVQVKWLCILQIVSLSPVSQLILSCRRCYFSLVGLVKLEIQKIQNPIDSSCIPISKMLYYCPVIILIIRHAT